MSTESPAENWRPLPGFSGYEVSDLGRVLSWKSKTPRLLRTGSNSRGYRTVQLSVHGQHLNRLVHLLILEAFVGPRPRGMETRHLNGQKTDNRLVNLKWGTHEENVEDIASHGSNYNANKTTCPQGHPYDSDNTYVQLTRPGRICRACDRERKRRDYVTAAAARSERAA